MSLFDFNIPSIFGKLSGNITTGKLASGVVGDATVGIGGTYLASQVSSVLPASLGLSLRETYNRMAQLLHGMDIGAIKIDLPTGLPDPNMLYNHSLTLSCMQGWERLSYSDPISHESFTLTRWQLSLHGTGIPSDLIQVVRSQLIDLLQRCTPYLNEQIVAGKATSSRDWLLPLATAPVEYYHVPTDRGLSPVLLPRDIPAVGLQGAVDDTLIAKAVIRNNLLATYCDKI